MGAVSSCCRAPSAGSGDEKVHKRAPETTNGAPLPSAPAGNTATPLSSSGAASPRSLPYQPSLGSGYYSVAAGSSDDDEDEWHDALSEIDLADALAEWEEQTLHGHDSGVDQAIQTLRSSGHLLPPALEAAAAAQRSSDREAADQLRAAALESGARVHVAASAPAKKAVSLARSRSEELRLLLERPAARAAVATAAQLAVNGRVLQAHAAAAEAAAAAGASLAELAALPPDALAAALPAGASLDVAGLVDDVQFVKEAIAALHDHTGWMVSRNDKLQVYYRHQRGTTVHSLKFSATFDHPLEHLLAIAHEWDLVPTWNKFSLGTAVLAEPSIFESYMYGAQWMMRPFKHMQGLVHARGFDLADEHRCLLVSLQDAAPEQLPPGHAPLPKEWPKRKLINIIKGSCLQLRPLPTGPGGTPRTEGSIMVHLDPHIPFIPAFLLNFVLGVLAPYIYKQIMVVLDRSFADPASVYNQRIRDQPHLYGLVQQRMAEFQAELSTRETNREGVAANEAALGGSSTRRRRRGQQAPSPS